MDTSDWKQRKHGMYGTPTYKSWRSMMKRCYQPTDINFKNYGARGIYVVKRWHDFRNFLVDMGERPSELSLDRINTNERYCKRNCRWADQKTQARNRRSNVYLKFNGQLKTLVEIAELTDIPYTAIKQRYRAGWSTKEILETSWKERRKSNANSKK